MTRSEFVKVIVIAADFNKAVVNAMIDAVKSDMTTQDVELLEVVRIPGCYELPLVSDQLLTSTDCDVLVVLGFIERGETLHGEVMGQVVHRALVDLSLKHQKPIGLGIIGPGATPEQAQARAAEYARSALQAALASFEACNRVKRAIH